MVVGQRYSVLLTTNQAAGPYWMRVELEAATTVAGANDDIRGVIRYGSDHCTKVLHMSLTQLQVWNDQHEPPDRHQRPRRARLWPLRP